MKEIGVGDGEGRGEGKRRGRDEMVNRRYQVFLSLSFQCYCFTSLLLFFFLIMCCISEVTEKMLKIQ